MRIRIFLKFFLILSLIIILGIGFYFYSIIKKLPPIKDILSISPTQSTKIFDRTGKILLYQINRGEKRKIIPSSEIPNYLKEATISIEDEDFYNHKGIDYKAIIRAFYEDLIHRKIIQGGSTITQQLIKNSLVGSRKTIKRKIKEAILSQEIENYYSKDEILTSYLNQICYGPSIYGVEEASQLYFGKPVSEINLAESALLAAIPKAPTYYSPWGNHFDELIERKNFILKKMFKLGFIDKEELQTSLSYKIRIKKQQENFKAPHFVIEVKKYLENKYGKKMVETGGLNVITTLDYPMQKIAEKVVKEGALRNEKLYNGKNAALMVEDPKTGQILAMVGSRDYFDKEIEGKFNVATQGIRQPGSTFKPFVYLDAFKKGYCPESIIFDTETNFKTPEGIYHPENFDHIFRGPVSFEQALACSINIPAVKIGYLVGLNNIIKTAKKFGLTTIKNPSDYGLSLPLGSAGVRLIDLIKAYSVLASDGVKHKQWLVLEVKDSQGNILEKYQDKKERIEDPKYIRMINNILSSKKLRTPLFGRSLKLTYLDNIQLALKTGTSNDYKDAWTIAYNPNLVVGVWAGNNDFSPMTKSGSSILAALPILHSFLEKIKNTINWGVFPPDDQCFANKPILRGEYIIKVIDNTGKEYPQLHNILYWVDKNNPTGPSPQTPSDPQFPGWEEGVIKWAKENIDNFSENYNIIPEKEFQFKKEGEINISNLNIKNGQFISSPFNIKFTIKSKLPLNKIKLFLNNNLIDQRDIKNLANNLDYNLQVKEKLNPQNIIKILIIDNSGNKKEKELIIYQEEKLQK